MLQHKSPVSKHGHSSRSSIVSIGNNRFWRETNGFLDFEGFAINNAIFMRVKICVSQVGCAGFAKKFLLRFASLASARAKRRTHLFTSFGLVRIKLNLFLLWSETKKTYFFTSYSDKKVNIFTYLNVFATVFAKRRKIFLPVYCIFASNLANYEN